MAVEPGYPVTLVHPGHKDAKAVSGNEPAQLEMFPGITVYGHEDEARYRAQGYLRHGEAPPKVDHHEYPKILRHPEYVPAVESRIEAKIQDGKIAGTFTIPAVPAQNPDLTVLNIEQEEEAREHGYKPAGEYDQGALNNALYGNPAEHAYSPQEYPKFVEGVLIEYDPDLPPPPVRTPDYPRFENGVVVQDPRFPAPPDPHEYPKWIHVDGVPSERSELVNNPREEFEIRAKLMPKVEEDVVEEEPLLIGIDEGRGDRTEVAKIPPAIPKRVVHHHRNQ